MIEIKLSYAPTREEAMENTRFWAPLSLPAEDKHRLDDPLEMAYAADKLPIEEVAAALDRRDHARGRRRGRPALRRCRLRPPGLPRPRR